MEEGPEPQELMEQVEHSIDAKHENKNPEHDHQAQKAKHLRSAVTAAVLAVSAALGSLLSGHSANDAILLQSKASDQWSYYQAKSTKGHLYEVTKSLVEALIQRESDAGGKEVVTTRTKPLKSLIVEMDDKMKVYAKENKEIEEQARDLETESTKKFGQHQLYSFAVACFQIGIVLASVSILVEGGPLFLCSIAGGVVGIVLMVYGCLS